MSDDNNKPREFWIYKPNKVNAVEASPYFGDALIKELPVPPNFQYKIHVIEKDKYDAVCRERDYLKGDRDKFLASDDCYYWTPESQAERDALQKENKILNERINEIFSYMPKVPTQSYEKELAKKIADLTEELDHWRNDSVVVERDMLLFSLKEVVSALDFYSEPSHVLGGSDYQMYATSDSRVAYDDDGVKARAALAKIRERYPKLGEK